MTKSVSEHLPARTKLYFPFRWVWSVVLFLQLFQASAQPRILAELPDFSYAGYMASEQDIPDVSIKVIVRCPKGDATGAIQGAIDYVGGLAADNQGFKGTVLLEKGTYVVQGTIQLRHSGVVLRGSGVGEDGTVLLGGGNLRSTLVEIGGIADRKILGSSRISQDAVPVGAWMVEVTDPSLFRPGDRVYVRRPSTKEWIDTLGMHEFGGETSWLGWKPDERDLFWDRTVVSVDGSTLVLDAPLTTSIEASFGGGYIEKYTWPGRISKTGVENLVCLSAYDRDNPKDEDHRWMAITMENVEDAWVRQVMFRHFAGSAVAIWESGRRITVQDCISEGPVSEIGGQRRYSFYTEGQQCLFQRLYAENGYHDFAVGFRASGPNAFVQCESKLPYSFSGTLDSWASGVLFDMVNVDGHKLSFNNRGQDAQGAGWTAANSAFWQCSAARIECFAPPTAQNYAIGTWGQFAGNGYWEESNSHVNPRSLFYWQLSKRLNKDFSERASLMPVSTEASSSPTVDQAEQFSMEARLPPALLKDWIEASREREPISVSGQGAEVWNPQSHPQQKELEKIKPLNIEGGRLIAGGQLLTGKRHQVSWWRGNVRYYDRIKASPHITRFVPGRSGWGLTDRLDEVIAWMDTEGYVAIEHNYGLWYDRRRDDHERVRRMNGEVWPPFYELPFARSGEGFAWDGLSLYDLTDYNPWYWARLKEFADLADRQGKVLLHHHYFQHNILEAGAHYADFPWRTVNNINETGFPEPPPYAGDKRIFMAGQFYDTRHEEYRKLHEAYIRKCLDNFELNQNVIHILSAEYTGPVEFVRFWLDVIADWQQEKGKDVIICLSATKDVQDAILSDPKRAGLVDIIDIRYWFYGEGGQIYAPEGGKNLAPRQQARLVKLPKETFQSVYRSVADYKEKFPDKAVIYSRYGSNAYPWAVLMAGGSLVNLPGMEAGVMEDLIGMKPDNSFPEKGLVSLKNEKGERILYLFEEHVPIEIDLSGYAGNFEVVSIRPENGEILERREVGDDRKVILQTKDPEERILWVNLK